MASSGKLKFELLENEVLHFLEDWFWDRYETSGEIWETMGILLDEQIN